jgi:pimeloyl-ACP methyl ester carboxylesterase
MLLYHKTYTHHTSKQWVVFIHGAGGSSNVWYKQVKDFKKHFNVLLIDLRGHGKSQNVFSRVWSTKYTFEDVSRDVLDVLDYLRIKKAHYVGISLGTIIIRTIAEIAPHRLESLILGGAVTRLTIKSRILVYIGNAVKRIVPYMWLYKIYALILLPKANHSESRNLFIKEAKSLYQKEFLRWFKLTKDLNPLLKFFRERPLKLPVFYVMGSEDYMFLEPVKEMVKIHHSSSLHVIENCGHVVNVEQPVLFNNAVINYISAFN